MSTPPEQKRFAGSLSPQFLQPEFLPSDTWIEPNLSGTIRALESLADYINDWILQKLTVRTNQNYLFGIPQGLQ